MAVIEHNGMDQQIFEAGNVAYLRFDLAGTVTYWNKGCELCTGYGPAEALGRNLTRLVVGPDERAWVQAVIAETLETGTWEGRVDVRSRDGSILSVRAHLLLTRGGDGRPDGLSAVCVDITEHLESERRLQSARTHLSSVADNMTEGMLACDDRGAFTAVNAAAERMLGYPTGGLADVTLHEVIPCPAALRTVVSGPDTPRDRPHVRVDDGAFVRADGSRLPVTYTVTAYTAEDGTRGRVVLFRDITERKDAEARLACQLDALRWVGRIRSALEEERFELYAQPIIDLGSGEVVQHELLLRMREHDGTLVPPGAFLPAAEEHGLILDIDRWVMRRALSYAAAGHAVELNLSAHSMQSCTMLQEFASVLAATGADPSLIVIELTETALLADADAAEAFITAVKTLGCRIALDDFGTGYGGFTYLKRLDVDYLKIDIEFVRDLVANQASQHVVKAVVSLARGFGQKTVAEGAEDAETLRLLADFGVDYAQGHVIRRPGSADELLAG